MDGTVAVAVSGFAGTVVTSLVAGGVAYLTSRSEKEATAETALEKTLRERLTFKDEQIESKDDLIGSLKEENSRKDTEIARLKGELQRYPRG